MSTIRKSKSDETKSKPLNLLWATDLHLDHTSPEKAAAFIREMAEKNPSLVVITGDISTAETVDKWLLYMDSKILVTAITAK